MPPPEDAATVVVAVLRMAADVAAATIPTMPAVVVAALPDVHALVPHQKQRLNPSVDRVNWRHFKPK